MSPRPGALHYGWVVVAVGSLVIFACLGLGRFALGMILPSMGLDLGLDYTRMGMISTGNFVGYLAAVLVSARVMSIVGGRRQIAAGLALIAACMFGISRAPGFVAVLTLYVGCGIGAGLANVPIMALVTHWFGRSLRGRASGFVVSGSGIAIVFSGWLIPWLNARHGADGWRIGWLVLGMAVLMVAVLSAGLLRNQPGDKGLEALERRGWKPPVAVGAVRRAARGAVAHLGVIYFLFGYTYVIYATFIVTALVTERGVAEAVAGQFWMWAGAISIVSGPLFGSLSDRLGRKAALAMVFSLHAASYLLMAFDLGTGAVYGSIFLWAIGVWSIPSIMSAAVGDYLGPQRAAAAFGTITLFFGVGQIAGPGLAGILADASGSFSTSFLMAAAAAGAAIAVSLLLRRPGE